MMYVWSNQICICLSILGDKCDKADECAKNPCQNGGTCHLDAKNHAVCTCTNGWSSNHCDKSKI
jgi:Notch-like protein